MRLGTEARLRGIDITDSEQTNSFIQELAVFDALEREVLRDSVVSGLNAVFGFPSRRQEHMQIIMQSLDSVMTSSPVFFGYGATPSQGRVATPVDRQRALQEKADKFAAILAERKKADPDFLKRLAGED